MSGCWGFFAYDAINPARVEVTQFMQHDIDDYFKQIMTVEPVEDKLFKNLNTCLKPSTDARKYLLHALRTNNHQKHTHMCNRPPSQQTTSSSSLTADLPSDMAAVLVLDDNGGNSPCAQASHITNVTFSTAKNTSGVSHQYNASNPFTPYTPTGNTTRMVWVQFPQSTRCDTTGGGTMAEFGKDTSPTSSGTAHSDYIPFDEERSPVRQNTHQGGSNFHQGAYSINRRYQLNKDHKSKTKHASNKRKRYSEYSRTYTPASFFEKS
jgi:hypothetical protein